MSDTQRDAGRLQAELAQLRTALESVQPPAPDEAALRAQFRAAAKRREQAAASAAQRPGSSRLHLAAAAVVTLAIGAVLAGVLLRVERPTRPVAVATSQPEVLPVSAFQPLLNSPGLSSASYSVVRVRIPLSAFAVVPGAPQDGMIEADLLVGEDGLARGIRFNEADALLVSSARQ
jgi:hypothetical protein